MWRRFSYLIRCRTDMEPAGCLGLYAMADWGTKFSGAWNEIKRVYKNVGKIRIFGEPFYYNVIKILFIYFLHWHCYNKNQI